MTAEQLWKEFCAKKNIDENTPYEAWGFGGGDISTDDLTKLVLERKKFGTASAYDEYEYENALDELPSAEDYSVLLYENEEAACVIKNYDVYIRAFGDVSPFHAYSEGEMSRSLKDWRDIHTHFFEPNLEEIGRPLTEESKIVCEKFSVEYVPGESCEDDEEFIYVEPSMDFADEIRAYRQEMIDADSSFDGCFSMKRLENTQDFVDSCINWSNPRRPADAHGAWGTVLLVLRKKDSKMVGCVQIHNVLTERMEKYTGHIGYSVRPSERRKGYATKILAKALDFLSVFDFEEAIVSCLTDNEGSKKTILKNGGKYIETVYLEEDDVMLERYRIALS